MIGLTPRQADLLAYLRTRAIAGNGVMPTVKDMTAHLGLRSTSNAHRLLSGLVDRGVIRRVPNRTRAFEIIDEAWKHSVRLSPEAYRAATAYAAALGQTLDQVVSDAMLCPCHRGKP